jgi:chromosome segregation ATPase
VRERRQPVDANAAEAVAAAVAPLQTIIETLSGELKATRDSNDALRDQLAAAQAETAELKGKSVAIEAALEREVVDRRGLQQQADHIRRERQRRMRGLSKPRPSSSRNDVDCRLLKIW